jgi:MFS family permease
MNKQDKIRQPWLTSTIFGFGLTSFFNDFSHEMTTAILPLFIRGIVGSAHTPLILGIMSGASNGISTIIKLIGGWLSDAIVPPRILLVAGYTLTPLFVGIIGFAHTAWQAILYKIVAWLGKGLREPVRDAWIAATVKPVDYGKAFGFNRALDTLGGITGPLVAYSILNTVSLRTIFIISFIPGFLSVASLVYFVQNIPQQPKSSHQSSRRLLTDIAQLPANFNYYVGSMFVFACSNFNKTLIIYRAQEMLTHTTSSLLVATGWTILLYIIFNSMRALSEYGLGAATDTTTRISKKNMLALAGFSLFGITSISLLIAEAQWWLWLLIFIMAAISTAAVTTLSKVYAAELLPASIRGTGYGLLQAAMGLGDLVSSVTVGLLWSFIGPWAGFSYAACLSFSAALLLLKGKSK